MSYAPQAPGSEVNYGTLPQLGYRKHSSKSKLTNR